MISSKKSLEQDDFEKVSSIFPIPLLGEELYFLLDDIPESPMNLWAWLQFSRNFERSTFEKALEISLKKHPLFSALFKGDVKNKASECFWIEPSGIRPFVDWDRLGVPLRFPNGFPIDLRREVGIRFFIREDDGQTELHVQVHHACCDGVGLILFLKDLFKIYKAVQTSNSDNLGEDFLPPPKEQRTLLLKRGKYFKKRPFKLKVFFQKLRGIGNFFFMKTALVSPSPLPEINLKSQTYPLQHSFVFSTDQTQSLSQLAMQKGANLTSLLLRDLISTCDGWNKKQAPHRKRRVGVGLATSFRHLLDPKTPVSMTTGAVVFYIKRRSKESSEQFLIRVNHLLLRYVKGHYGFIGIKILRFFGKMKRGLYTFHQMQGAYMTTILSFLGEVETYLNAGESSSLLQDDSLRLDKLAAIAPAISGSHFSILAWIFRGQLNITLAYNPKKISEENAKEFLVSFVKQIESNGIKK